MTPMVQHAPAVSRDVMREMMNRIHKNRRATKGHERIQYENKKAK
jgi:hypothetical protein